jgi:hypothetical protein
MTDYIFEENTKFYEYLRYSLSYLDKSKHVSNPLAIQLIFELHKNFLKKNLALLVCLQVPYIIYLQSSFKMAQLASCTKHL